MGKPVVSHRQLRVYQHAAAARRRVFELSLRFPPYEKYDLTAQFRTASRSVCGCIGEAWRKRRYPLHWTSKLTEAESEAAEAQIWAETALECGYIDESEFEDVFSRYEAILGQLVLMGTKPDQWEVPTQQR